MHTSQKFYCIFRQKESFITRTARNMQFKTQNMLPLSKVSKIVMIEQP